MTTYATSHNNIDSSGSVNFFDTITSEFCELVNGARKQLILDDIPVNTFNNILYCYQNLDYSILDVSKKNCTTVLTVLASYKRYIPADNQY